MKHDYKLSGVKYYNFEEDCKCKKGDKMKHDWEFVRVVYYGFNDQDPVASYVCNRCRVKAEVHINHPNLAEEDCKGVDNSFGAIREQLNHSKGYLDGLKDCVGLFKSQLNDQKKIDIIINSIANISDRLDKLEKNSWKWAGRL